MLVALLSGKKVNYLKLIRPPMMQTLSQHLVAYSLPTKQNRTCFTGILSQDRDTHVETGEDLTVVTKRAPDERERKDLLIAAVTTKHLKSNSVALVKDGTLLAM